MFPLARASESAGVTWGFCQSAIVPAPRFNDMIDKWDSKSRGAERRLDRVDASLFRGDRRRADAAAPSTSTAAATPTAPRCSTPSPTASSSPKKNSRKSVYRVEGLDRPVRITFMPKADVEHFTVALASILSKYVRELLMREFNRYWQTHVPGLKPTAGYPQDAGRFFAAIRPALLKMGLVERAVWRRR